MTTERNQTHSTNRTKRINGTNGAHAPKFFVGLPSHFESLVKEHPYRALGIACALGLGTGIAVSSRVLRMTAVSAVSAAIVEIGRYYLLRDAD